MGGPSGILPSGRQGPAGQGSLVDELLRELAWLVLNRVGERGSSGDGWQPLVRQPQRELLRPCMARPQSTGTSWGKSCVQKRCCSWLRRALSPPS